MQTAIERLRASKQEMIAEHRQFGQKDGREWAESKASYFDLLRIAKIDLSEKERQPEGTLKILHKHFDPAGEQSLREFAEAGEVLGVTDPDDEYAVGWIAGAQQFYQDVVDKL